MKGYTILGTFITVLVAIGIVAIFFDWDFIAAFEWAWGIIVTIFDWTYNFLINFEWFRYIVGDNDYHKN